MSWVGWRLEGGCESMESMSWAELGDLLGAKREAREGFCAQRLSDSEGMESSDFGLGLSNFVLGAFEGIEVVVAGPIA